MPLMERVDAYAVLLILGIVWCIVMAVGGWWAK